MFRKVACTFGFSIVLAALCTEAEANLSNPNANELIGYWVYKFPCDDYTGVYANRCLTESRDDFSLFIESVGTAGKLCGGYELTSGLGNKVDDGELREWLVAPAAPHTYRLRFHTSGTRGEATISVTGNTLSWSIVREQNGPEDIWAGPPPHHAILVKQKPRGHGSSKTCKPTS